MRENISVLIPWRGGDPQRERVWNFVKSEWEKTGVELCVGVDDPGGPFNCSRALNRAFRMSTKPIIMQFGADCLPSTAAIDLAYTMLVHDLELNWIPLFDRTDYYNEFATNEILRGIPRIICTTDPNLAVPFQTGVLAMTREAFLETGGSDERFEGWGAEDSAFRMCLWRLNGGGTPLPFTLRCLWHNNEHRVLGEENLTLCQEYERIETREDMLLYIDQRGHYV
jgi:hypothetical protein